jgi:hypothetical protein
MQPVFGLVPHRAAQTVDHLVGDLMAAVRRKAVQHNRVRIGQCQELGIDLKWPERLQAVSAVVLLTHRCPGVGGQDVGAFGGGPRVGGYRDRGAGGRGAPFGGGPHRLVGRECAGSGDRDVNAGGGAAQQQRVRHVVGAVAEIGQFEPGQRPLAFGDRLQVGQHLAGMELVGERVDHRHRCGRGHRGEPILAEGAPHDRIDVAGQHFCGVAQRLVAAQLGAAGVDHHRVPAQLGNAQLEREPGPGRAFVEDHCDTARSFERTMAQRILLQLGSQLEDFGLLYR